MSPMQLSLGYPVGEIPMPLIDGHTQRFISGIRPLAIQDRVQGLNYAAPSGPVFSLLAWMRASKVPTSRSTPASRI